MGLSEVLLSTVRMWIWYTALEPFERKIWPQLLISSSRLQEGRFTDPRVGRDLLVGAMFGVIAALVGQLTFEFAGQAYVARKFGPTEVLTLDGTRELLGSAALAHAWAFFGALLGLMGLLVLRIVLGTERRAILRMCAVFAFVIAKLSDTPLIVGIVTAAICTGLIFFLMVRFGNLAVITQMTCTGLLERFPLTLDSSRWYFSHGMFAVALIILVALYGFYPSTYGRSTASLKAARLRSEG